MDELNFLYDRLLPLPAEIALDGSELRVSMVILRKMMLENREYVRVSMSGLARMAGITKERAIHAISRGIERGTIDRRSVKNSFEYRFKVAEEGRQSSVIRSKRGGNRFNNKTDFRSLIEAADESERFNCNTEIGSIIKPIDKGDRFNNKTGKRFNNKTEIGSIIEPISENIPYRCFKLNHVTHDAQNEALDPPKADDGAETAIIRNLLPLAASAEVVDVTSEADDSGYPEEFQRFLDAWPPKRRKKPGDAFKAWKTLRPSKALQVRILAAVESAKNGYDWQKENGRFIPYPATWLRADGWNETVTPWTAADAALEPKTPIQAAQESTDRRERALAVAKHFTRGSNT